MKSSLTWITGAGGLIGSHLIRSAPPGPLQAVALTRATLDLCDFAAVQEAFQRDRPEVIVHCAALSKTPDCVRDPALAFRVNVEATKNLATLASGSHFIFFSSDLVFDGRQGAYMESDRVNPLSIYGETKAEAEKFVLENPNHAVVRTSLNGGHSPTGDRGFNEELERHWRAGHAPTLFTDEYRSPMAASVTAAAVWELVAAKGRGLFHLAGSEKLSRHEIGRLVAGLCPELQPRIAAGSLREYNGPPRAPDTSLNCAKLQELLSFPLPRFSEWIKEHPEDF